MLILLTLSFLPSGDRNSTSGLISSGMNLGGNVKKSFQILLNDTEIMETPKIDLNNEKKLNSKPDKRFMKQIVHLLNQRFSTPPNVRDKEATGNIQQGDNTFYNTPPVLNSSPKVSKKYKKRFNLVGVHSNISKTIAGPISSAVNILDGKNAYYNTPPQARLLRQPRILQKKQKIILNLNRLPEDLKKTPASEEITTNNLYYNTPAVLREVENIAILKDQYGIEKNITQRKKTRYILRSHRNTRKNTTTHKGHAAHRVRETNKKSHLKVTETILTSADMPQSIGSAVNMSSQNKSAQNSELRKIFHKPLRIESTFAAVSLLKGDEQKEFISDTLLDMNQAVPAASVEEESSEIKSSVSPNLMIRSSSLAPGDILNGFVNTQPSTIEPYLEEYYKKMAANNVRYLSIAFEDLCDHLASKKLEHVTEIVQHIDVTVQELQRKGRLRWLGEPMTTILRDLAILLAGDSADALQVRAMILKSLMQQRRKIVGTDVNEVLDYADSLITKEDGEQLLAVMQEVKRYPDVNKSGKELCKEIIEAFETPFFHLTGTKNLDYLVKKANKAFADRFQQYSNFEEVKDSPPGRLDGLGRMPQRNVNLPKILSVTKSGKTTHAVKHSSRNSHPFEEKSLSIDKYSSKEERQSKDHSLKDKQHIRHKHSSRHRHSSKKKNKQPSEEKEENVEGNMHKDSRSKDLHSIKYSSKGSTALKRKHAYLKPGLLMGNK